VTTIDQQPAYDPDADTGELPDLSELVEEFRDPDRPVPLMAGTFALYLSPDGSLMLVTQIPDGPWSADPRTAGVVGTKHTRVPAGVIRAMSALASGSKLGVVRAMLGRGRRAEPS
jgi:hypothetical protein